MYTLSLVCIIHISAAFAFEATFVRNTSEIVSDTPFPPNYSGSRTEDEVQHIHDFHELWYVILEEARLNRMEQNSSTPTYMLDLYRSVKGPKSTIHPSEVEASVIQDSDTVRSFLPLESDIKEDQGRFSFNLSVIEPEEDIRLCEVRVSNRLFRWTDSDEVRISIYQTCNKRCQNPDACISSTRISTTKFSLTIDKDEDQYVFDITRPIRYALQMERSSYCALEIVITDDEELHDSGGRSRREILGRIDVASGMFIPTETAGRSNRTDNVVLVAFTRDTSPKNVLRDAKVHENSATSFQTEIVDTGRERRDLREDRRRKKERDRNKEKKQQQEIEKYKKLASELLEVPTCQRVSFEINFQQIGWSRWIIYPQNFEAYRCEGSCMGPMTSEHNPSNHAVMQSLVNQKRPDLVPPVCCVPTKLVPLSMLYFEQGTIALKKHDEMVVTECGCR
ncbi:nodal homolog 2-A-like [Antedon mediterranea]|uniref:nodal homolog 2-A-like n=1 Tax=Antedon mediterranea TaxID=105859 RepID=UPI003AF8B9B4